MKNINFKAFVPHIVAIAIFLIVAMVYCSPAFQGKVLYQNDNMHWKGMAQNSFEYKEQKGHFPFWNTHLFSGMPNYQVAMEAKSFLPDSHAIFSLGLPKPAGFFFLACISFYLLCCTLKIRPAIGILGSLAFAYGTYNAIIIAVGHDTKMLTIAYMPALLSGILLIYKKRYWAGLVIAIIAGTWEVAFNHPQMTYYFAIATTIISIGYIITFVKEKSWKHITISIALIIIAGITSVANSAMTLMTTAEYAKYTMRGGKTIETSGDGIKKVETKGLDKDYAFSYSIGKSEILTVLMPDLFGESSAMHFDENSVLVRELTDKNIPENQAIQIAASLPRYWGGMQEGSGGTYYYGAIICFLALIAMVVLKNPIKWWIAAAAVFFIFISWGGNFYAFNSFLIDYFPLYNKFRAPSSALILPQFLLCLLAVMGLQEIFFSAKGKEALQASFKKIFYVLGGLFAITLLVYFFNDFRAAFDAQLTSPDPNQQANQMGSIVLSALKAERKSMFMASVFRALLFAGLVVGLLFLYVRNSLKPLPLIIIFTVINTVDLLVKDSHYLNSENYLDEDSYQSQSFHPTAANTQILQDKDPHYRVYSLSPDRFSEATTSYFHRSVGGYHAAKLRIYQDLIETQLAKSPMNMDVLNMLDTRYFIIPPQQQQQQYSVYKNDSALGAVWFVKHIQYVNGPVEEIKAMDKFGPKDTAIIDVGFKNIAGNDPVYDTAAVINMESYDNDEIKYSSTSSSPQFAVFSEVYYPAGWNAYLDGKKVDYVKVNYVLRGMPVPAGKHEIIFKFEPASYYTGQKLIYFGNILFYLALAIAAFSLWRNRALPNKNVSS
ncbi:MAG: YfhO family protein [Chitinophagaceae bacterium]|nr:YfhO family protein [Chitinophagaceae bacterium]